MHVTKFSYQLDAGTIQIAFVAFERQFTYERVASILYDEHIIMLQDVDIIILRPPVDRQLKKIPIKKVSIIVKRFPNLPLYLLYSNNYKIQLSDNLNSKAKTQFISNYKKTTISFLKEKQLQDFVLKSMALFRSPEHTVYRMPSQEYSHSFLRVGNIQTSRHVIDSIFFWALPYLKDAGSILTDSWSISSIALNISRLLCRYDKNVRLDKFHVNMLTTHFDGRRTMDRDTENDLYTLAYRNNKKILFLVSAVKTLKSLENINRAFNEVSFPFNFTTLAIYRLVENATIEALCILGDKFCKENGFNFDSFSEPPNNETVIEIDNKVFFPVKINESEIELRKPATKDSEDFFKAYEGKNIIYIHRDSFYNNTFNSIDKFRHHGIYIDVSKLLETERFMKGLKEKIDVFKKCPSVIIFPPHAHGKDLVETIKKLLKLKFTIDVPSFAILDLNFPQLGKDDEVISILNSLTNTDFILIVDDVSTTGARLRGYQKYLRGLYKGQIGYFIGVARPDNPAKWDKNMKDLIYRPSKNGLPLHTVTFIEKIILPDWDEKTCPWCIEKRCIARAISKYESHPVSKWLTQRLYSLSNGAGTGLVDDVFQSIDPINKPSFQGGSIFASNANISEADLVAIVATSIQNLRNVGGIITGTDKISKLIAEYPHFKILNIQSYLGSDASFNEALIKAIIFRSCYKWELHATEDTNLQKQKVGIGRFINGENIQPSEYGFFIYELYLALKERKLPKPPIGKKLFKMLDEVYEQSSLGTISR